MNNFSAVVTSTTSHWYTSPEWWLVLAALLTLIVVIWQTAASARAANAAVEAAKAGKDSAESAKLSVQALIDSERAWLHAEFVQRQVISGVSRYSLVIRNQGKTPAEVFGYDIWHGILTEGTPFSKGSLTTHFSEAKQIFIGGGATEVLRDDFDLDDLFTLKSGNTAASAGHSTGAFCATIRYADVVTQERPKPEHLTSFVYFCNLLFGTVYRAAEYNEYT